MEESKELQGFYRIFRAIIYISVLMEFLNMHWIQPCLTIGAEYCVIYTDVSSAG